MKGDRGTTGSRGFDGSSGSAGRDGSPGQRGLDGMPGNVGPKGFTGATGGPASFSLPDISHSHVRLYSMCVGLVIIISVIS